MGQQSAQNLRTKSYIEYPDNLLPSIKLLFVMFLKNHQILVLKSHKTAGTSLEIALSQFAEPGDVITPIVEIDEQTRRRLGFPGPQNYQAVGSEVLLRNPIDLWRSYNVNALRAKYWNHMSSASVRRAVGQKVWESCERVTIMRNPFEKIVSWFFWNQREVLTNRYSEKEIVSELFPSWVTNKVPTFLADQKIYRLNGLSAMTRYLRLEKIDDELRSLEKSFGFPGLHKTFSSIRAKSGHRPNWGTTERFFSENHATRKRIEEIYDWEISEFGYTL